MDTSMKPKKSLSPESQRSKSRSDQSPSSPTGSQPSRLTTGSTTSAAQATPRSESRRVCPGCGGKKAAHAVTCRACHSAQRRNSSITLKCSCCEKSFEREKAEHQKSVDRHGDKVRSFCSRVCYDKYKAQHPESYSKVKGSCAHCAKPLIGFEKNKFCSFDCYSAHRAARRQTESYGGEFLALKSKVVKRDGKCLMCGTVSARFEAHHINQDEADSRESNLICLCVACHRKYHQLTEPVRLTLQGLFQKLIS